MKKEPFFSLSYGLYVVASAQGDQRGAYIANTVFQVSADPAMFAISCHKDNTTAAVINESKAFSFSVLEKDAPLAFIQALGYKHGEDKDKFRQLNYTRGTTGVPMVYDHFCSWFECRVTNRMDVGTHWLIIGEAVDNGMLSGSAEPLTYAWYRKHHKALSPSTAPTYVAMNKENTAKTPETTGGTKYACTVCEYVYNPAKGDPENSIEPGTPFEELPADWVCPVCGASTALFTETT